MGDNVKVGIARLAALGYGLAPYADRAEALDAQPAPVATFPATFGATSKGANDGRRPEQEEGKSAAYGRGDANDAESKQLIIDIENTALPTKHELMVLAIAACSCTFSSGMVLHATRAALGQPISVTSLHRALNNLVAMNLLREDGAIIDGISGRPTLGYVGTHQGREVLRYTVAAAEAIRSAKSAA